jgi:hypothetical protein
MVLMPVVRLNLEKPRSALALINLKFFGSILLDLRPNVEIEAFFLKGKKVLRKYAGGNPARSCEGRTVPSLHPPFPWPTLFIGWPSVILLTCLPGRVMPMEIGISFSCPKKSAPAQPAPHARMASGFARRMFA